MTSPVLSIAAPSGAHFDFEEVKTAKGTQTLGPVPILVWDSADGLVSYYGEEGVLSIADGTSVRVSCQNIARRLRSAGKSDEEIAQAQINFRPGKRQVGVSTPQSRAARAARTAVEKGADSSKIEKLLELVASGKLSDADIDSLTS